VKLASPLARWPIWESSGFAEFQGASHSHAPIGGSSGPNLCRPCARVPGFRVSRSTAGDGDRRCRIATWSGQWGGGAEDVVGEAINSRRVIHPVHPHFQAPAFRFNWISGPPERLGVPACLKPVTLAF